MRHAPNDEHDDNDCVDNHDDDAMNDASVETTNGLTVLHLFANRTAHSDDAKIIAAVETAQANKAQVVPVAILGHHSELCFMSLHKDAWVLRDFQTALTAAGLDIVDSYLSITELSEYAADLPEAAAQARLLPQLPPPDKPAWCFYPMSKRRNPDQNWYELDFDTRKNFMYEHGASGRQFLGRIVQLVTASTGLDNHEWGVTLFGTGLEDLKDAVYTMRYDTASARYAEFGDFITGLVGTTEDILARTSHS